MQPYNVEIYSPYFELKQHYNVGDIAYKYDYLSSVENTVTIEYDPSVARGDYIRIVNTDTERFGVITNITVGEQTNASAVIRYAPFEKLFDADILFDTSLQGSERSLEDVIAQYITDYFISNDDEWQNIPGLEVHTISSTSSWGFHLTPDVAGLTKAVINLSSVLIQKAMTMYQVCLYVAPDFNKRKIQLEIGRKATGVHYIEADLPNVVKKSIVLNETTKDVNKLCVYNSANLEDVIIYYKHPDKSYDTIDSNRITPVVYDLQTATVSGEQTFESAAAAVASRTFDVASYNNLIELTVLNDDSLVNVDTIAIGQEVLVVSEGNAYSSVFTGFDIGTKTKLIFGTVRLDLTKILKGANNGR